MEALLERFLWTPDAVNTESTPTSLSTTILAWVWWEWGVATVPVPCWWCTREEEVELWWVGLEAVTLVWLLLLAEMAFDTVDEELLPVFAWWEDWVMTVLPTVRMVAQAWLDEGSTGNSSSTNCGVSPIVSGMGPSSPRSSERECDDSFSSIRKCLRFSCMDMYIVHGGGEKHGCLSRTRVNQATFIFCGPGYNREKWQTIKMRTLLATKIFQQLQSHLKHCIAQGHRHTRPWSLFWHYIACVY